MRKLYPAMPWLRAFVVTARHGSIDRNGIVPPRVGRQQASRTVAVPPTGVNASEAIGRYVRRRVGDAGWAPHRTDDLPMARSFNGVRAPP